MASLGQKDTHRMQNWHLHL